jgi:hypothetical protein
VVELAAEVGVREEGDGRFELIYRRRREEREGRRRTRRGRFHQVAGVFHDHGLEGMDFFFI